MPNFYFVQLFTWKFKNFFLNFWFFSDMRYRSCSRHIVKFIFGGFKFCIIVPYNAYFIFFVIESRWYKWRHIYFIIRIRRIRRHLKIILNIRSFLDKNVFGKKYQVILKRYQGKSNRSSLVSKSKVEVTGLFSPKIV